MSAQQEGVPATPLSEEQLAEQARLMKMADETPRTSLEISQSAADLKKFESMKPPANVDEASNLKPKKMDPANLPGRNDFGQKLVPVPGQSIARLPVGHPTGGWHFSDLAEIARQRAVVWAHIQKGAKQLLQAKDLINQTLPVGLFEPRSYLQVICDNWVYGPLFMKRAVEATDPIERFKHVLCFTVAGLHCTVTQDKPFNPILGETYQAEYSDGSKVYLEQSSHHPPISHWELIGPNDSYRLYGHGLWSAGFRGNSIRGQQHGDNIIIFKDGTRYSWELPKMTFKGIMWGDRIFEYTGTLTLTDETNDIECVMTFNPDPPGMISRMFSSKAKLPSDFMRGEIRRRKPGTGRPASPKSDDSRNWITVCSVVGSWIGGLEFDGKAYWVINEQSGETAQPVADRLPSDCTYRKDLINLLEQNMELAAKYKHELEEVQRRDRKLRAAAKNA